MSGEDILKIMLVISCGFLPAIFDKLLEEEHEVRKELVDSKIKFIRYM